MDTSKINLFVFDTRENFEKSRRSIGQEGVNFMRIICVEDFAQFESELNSLKDDALAFLVVHVFYTQQIAGIKRFISSNIPDKYPHLDFMYISDGIPKDINHEMLDAEIDYKRIYKYHQVLTTLRSDNIKVYTKHELVNFCENGSNLQDNSKLIILEQYPKINYAIITALYKDEFEQLEKVFDFPEEEIININNKEFYVGYLKSNRLKKVIAAVQNNTGMVDAAIISTQLIELFKPSYLLMSGVCGGLPDQEFGDIIVAKQIFSFQKGKINDIYKPQIGVEQSSAFLDRYGQPLDLEQVYDMDGKQVTVSIERFDRELDAVGQLHTALEDKINRKLEDIKKLINAAYQEHNFFKNPKKIDIVIAPMACSTMVINKEGYFDANIKTIDRKTAAVEMESYGVAKACRFANNGGTIPIIFKSVMDRTERKNDVVDGFDNKKFAAYTSAQFMKQLLELNII